MPKFLITKCLTWNELSPEQRAKVIDKNRDIRLDWLSSEDIVWNFSEAGNKIADAGFLNPDVYYDYSCSQGDGACFDCEIFNWELLLEDLNIPRKKFFIKYLENGTNIEYGIRRPNAGFAWHYYHERCREFYIESKYGWNNQACRIFNKIEEHIEKKRLTLCQEAFSEVCKAIDWLQSDECITEELECRDYYYNEETLCVADDTKLVDMPIKEEKCLN